MQRKRPGSHRRGGGGPACSTRAAPFRRPRWP